MVLSEKEIRALIFSGSETPLISPFSEEQLQGASYDLSLAGSIEVLKSIGKVIDPMEDQLPDDAYEQIELGNEGYVLSPGEFVLVQLQERIAIPANCVAHIRPRTRFTRSGVLVADQHCNPTYEGVLHLGLFNMGANPFRLTKGLRVAQIVFEKLSSTPSEEKLYRNKKNAAFQQETAFRGSKFGEKGWSPAAQQMYDAILSALMRGE